MGGEWGTQGRGQERPRQQCPCAKVGGTAVVGPGTEGKAFMPLWWRALGARSGSGRQEGGDPAPLAKLLSLGPVTLGPSSFTSVGALCHLPTLVWSFLPRRPPDALPLSLPTAWSQDRPRYGRDHSDLPSSVRVVWGASLQMRGSTTWRKTVSSNRATAPPTQPKPVAAVLVREGLCAASASAGEGSCGGPLRAAGEQRLRWATGRWS